MGAAMRRLLFETVILPRIFFSSKFPTEHKLRKPNPNPDTAIAPPKNSPISYSTNKASRNPPKTPL